MTSSDVGGATVLCSYDEYYETTSIQVHAIVIIAIPYSAVPKGRILLFGV